MVAENLVNTERRMLKAMLTESTKVWSLSEILSACDWQDQAIAVGAGLGLTDKGLVELTEIVTTEVKLGVQGQSAMSEGLLEARLWNWFTSTTEPSMANLQQSFERHEAGPGIGLLKKLGITMDGGTHWIRPLRMWFGEIVGVQGATARMTEEVEGETFARAIFHHGENANAFFSSCCSCRAARL